MSNKTPEQINEITKNIVENYKAEMIKYGESLYESSYVPYPVPEGIEDRGKIIQNILDSNEYLNSIEDLNYLMYLFNDVYADENSCGFNNSWRFDNLYFQYYNNLLRVEIKFDKSHEGIIRNGYNLMKDTLDKILIRDIARLVIPSMFYTLPTNLNDYNLRLNHYDTLIPKEGYIKFLKKFIE